VVGDGEDDGVGREKGKETGEITCWIWIICSCSSFEWFFTCFLKL
jgi:hypothetical protein